MTFSEAKEAIERRVLVGTSDVRAKAFCLYLTGYLIKTVKVRRKRKRQFLFIRGKKEEQFLFRDRAGEIEIIRPASAFSFAN